MRLREGMKCNLEDLTAIYASRQVAQAILDSALKHETVDMIESGQCNLPEPHEAHEFHRVAEIDRKYGKTALARAMLQNPVIHAHLAAMEDRLTANERAITQLTQKGGK